MTAAQQQDKLSVVCRSIQLAGKTIYINPFLYWRRFDSNTAAGSRAWPAQWSRSSKTAAVFMEWCSLMTEIKDCCGDVPQEPGAISTFHPELTSGQILEVERKMAITKKRSFERWVEKSYRRRSREETKKKRRFARNRFLQRMGRMDRLGHDPSGLGANRGAVGAVRRFGVVVWLFSEPVSDTCASAAADWIALIKAF